MIGERTASMCEFDPPPYAGSRVWYGVISVWCMALRSRMRYGGKTLARAFDRTRLRDQSALWGALAHTWISTSSLPHSPWLISLDVRTSWSHPGVYAYKPHTGKINLMRINVFKLILNWINKWILVVLKLRLNLFFWLTHDKKKLILSPIPDQINIPKMEFLHSREILLHDKTGTNIRQAAITCRISFRVDPAEPVRYPRPPSQKFITGKCARQVRRRHGSVVCSLSRAHLRLCVSRSERDCSITTRAVT